MSEWMKNITGYILMISIVMQMIPDSKYEQYIRLFTGFFLIILVMQPILKIGSADEFVEQRVVAFVKEQENLEQQIGMQSETFCREIEQRQEDEKTEIEIKEVEQVYVEVLADD